MKFHLKQNKINNMNLNKDSETLSELFNIPKQRAAELDKIWIAIAHTAIDSISREDGFDQHEFLSKILEPCKNENERLLAMYHAGRVVQRITEEIAEECDCPICTLRRKLEEAVSEDSGDEKREQATEQNEPIKVNNGARKVFEVFNLTEERKSILERQIHSVLEKFSPKLFKGDAKGFFGNNIEAFSKIGDNAQERAYAMWVCGYKCNQAKMINANPLLALMTMANDTY